VNEKDQKILCIIVHILEIVLYLSNKLQ